MVFRTSLGSSPSFLENRNGYSCFEEFELRLISSPFKKIRAYAGNANGADDNDANAKVLDMC